MTPPHLAGTPTGRLWFPKAGTNPRAKLRLFCFPYAGGSGVIFQKWQRSFPAEVEVVPAHLPMRAPRLLEPPFLRMEPLVKALAEVIQPYLDLPYVFFGHSMGAAISFELTRALRRLSSRAPEHLFVAGRRAPQVPDDDPPLYNLPEKELLVEIQRLSGTPKEVIENQELMQLVLPLLRSDFELIDTYEYKEEAPLECPISAYGGLQDLDVAREQIEAWRDQTISTFRFRMFPGDHFFINSEQSFVLRILSEELHHILTKILGTGFKA
jgi:medium-chain acyl-[acyl-carrier-protein] hydrolase